MAPAPRAADLRGAGPPTTADVVIVDWLGRGGIAQCTRAWLDALEGSGQQVLAVTVGDRELTGHDVLPVAPNGNRLRRHREVAEQAAAVIRRTRPATVVVQNYVVPLLERPVLDAARSVGARLVWVVHNHRAHSLMGGSHVGLRRNLDGAAVVVAHSAFVAERVDTTAPVVQLPLPVPAAYTPGPQDRPLLTVGDGGLLALHFGVLKRGYKGTGTVTELAAAVAARPSPRWWVGAVGVGAPAPSDRLVTRSGFVPAGELAATVEAAAATLLPYRAATQSAAVALSQSLGTVPVASAVGGITEQIDDGSTGLLLPADAGVGDWVDALRSLEDDTFRRAIGERCVAASRRNDERFRTGVRELVTA